MACYRCLNLQTYCLWRGGFGYLARRGFAFARTLRVGGSSISGGFSSSLKTGRLLYRSAFITLSNKNYSDLASVNSSFSDAACATSESDALTSSKSEYTQGTFLGSVKDKERAVNVDPSNVRVMLIDGTAIIYRAYFKLLANLHHGNLSHADGNGDWVLTIFRSLSLIIDVLEFMPSHVVVVFDHDGERQYMRTMATSRCLKVFLDKSTDFLHL